MEGASETFVGYEYRTAARISECSFPSMLCKWTVTSLCMIAIWHWGESIELKSDLSFSLFSHPVDTWFWRGHSTYLENFSHQWRVAQDITSNMYCSSVVWALFFALLKKKSPVQFLGVLHCYWKEELCWIFGRKCTFMIILKLWLYKLI